MICESGSDRNIFKVLVVEMEMLVYLFKVSLPLLSVSNCNEGNSLTEDTKKE